MAFSISDDTGIWPMPGVDGPEHLLRVVRIDIGIDHHDYLHPVMRGERRLQYRAGLGIVGFDETDDAAEDMSGKSYVANIRE